jgi:hypothetical protein
VNQLTVDAFPLTTDLFYALAAAEECAWVALLAPCLIGDYEPNTDDYEYQQLLVEGRL